MSNAHPTATLLLATSLMAPTAQANEGEAMYEVYRGFMEAIETAESFDALEPYMPDRFKARIAQVPEDQLAGYLKRIQDQPAETPAGDIEIAGHTVEGDEGELVLRAVTVGDTVRETAQARIDFVRDADGWKPESLSRARWSKVEVLPASIEPPGGAREAGPGAAPVDRPLPPLERYGLVMQSDETLWNGNGESKLLFDPRGQYVLIDADPFVALDLGTLETRWASTHSRGADWPTLSADGREIVALSNMDPVAIPVLPHFDGNGPQDGYFFSQPLADTVAAAAGGAVLWRGVAFHPSEPLLAIGAERTAEPASRIVFQPTGDGLWRGGDTPAATAWEVPLDTWRPHWSPTGDLLAYVAGFPDPGVPLVFRAWPGGEIVAQYSEDGYGARSVLFSPDGARAAVLMISDAGSKYVVVDARTGEPQATIPTGTFKAMAFAPDGEHLVGTGDVPDMPMIEKGEQDTVYTWKVGADQRSRLTEAFAPEDNGLPVFIGALGFSPNGRFLVAVGEEGQLRVWDAVAE